MNETEAEEVVQDTVPSVAKKMPGFTYDPGKDSFKGWLLTVTRWRILDHLEKRKGHQGRFTSSPSTTGEDTSTATVERVPDPAGFDLAGLWDEEWDQHLLQAALGRIKRQVHPQHYEIHHLYVILEKPMREVARTLGVNAGQIYLAKHRVGALLKKEIKRFEKQGGVESPNC